MIALVVVLLTVAPARAEDARCQQLRELHARYAGASLTGAQERLKVQLLAWYRANCVRERARNVTERG